MVLTGMNKIIGITGYMSVGKSYVLSNLLSIIDKDYILVDVDIFRRKLLKENSKYVDDLKKVILELNNFNEIDSVILNNYIYSNYDYMEEYKKILYKYLFDYIDSFQNKLIFVEWALIINDNLINKFDKLIVIDSSYENRLNRLVDSDLGKEEVLRRFKLQEIDNREEILNISNEDYIIINNDGEVDYKNIIDFIGR
jgi:dephospho-CoA kinase